MLISRLCLAAVATTVLLSAGELSGRRAPGFAIPDATMRYHDLNDYAGKVVLLDIMQTTCPNCKKLSATLERAKARYGDKVAVLSIVNPPDNMQTVAGYVKEQKVTIPVLFDCGQVAASYLKITPQRPTIHVPHLFVIDGKGWIRNDFEHSPATVGIFEGDALFAEIENAMKPAPAPAKPAGAKKQ